MRPLFAIVACLLFLTAAFFPQEQLENRKQKHLAQLQQIYKSELASLQAGDDPYVDPVTQPLDFPGTGILRALLVFDGVLLCVLGWRFKSRHGTMRLKESTRPSWSMKDWLALTALLVTALLVRLLPARGDLWLDEITTLVRHARGSAIDLFLQSTSSNNHLLNSLLCHWSIRLFGESELTLRLPSILFGLGTVGVVYFLGSRVFSRQEGVLAGLALALSYHHAFFSVNARGYTGFMFGAVLAAYLYYRGQRDDAGSYWGILYTSSLVICQLSLLLGATVLIAHTITTLGQGFLQPESRRFARRALTYQVLAAYLCAHAYAMMIPDVLGFVTDDYRRPTVGWKLSPEFFQVVLDGLLPSTSTLALLVLGLAGSFVVGGFIDYARRTPYLCMLLVLPTGLTLSLTLLLGANIFPRFFILALPAALLFLIRPVSLLIRHGGRAQNALFLFGLIALILGSAWMLPRHFQLPKQDYSGARRYVEAHSVSGEVAVSVGIAAEGYRYYWPQSEFTNQVSRVQSLMGQHEGVWLLMCFPEDMKSRRPRLLDFVKDRFTLVETFPGTVGDGEIEVYYWTDSAASP